MGVYQDLGSVNFTPAGFARAAALGVDLPGFIANLQLSVGCAAWTMQSFINDVLVPAGAESANIVVIQGLIAALDVPGNPQSTYTPTFELFGF